MFNINASTKQLGIIGNPVEHSFSPMMHNFISEIMGNNYVYSAWKVEDVENAVKGIRALGIRGVNVTAPHKQIIMKYLDEIDEDAVTLGSVNTIVNQNGVLKGYNTDAEGFYLAMAKRNIKISGAHILVLGAGGVTRPALLRIIRENPKSVTVMNRTKEKAVLLKEQILKQSGFEIFNDIRREKYDIVINTTSAGMEKECMPTDSISGIDNIDFIDENTWSIDMIYNPSRTLFLKESQKRGANVMNGLGMLIYQGIIAYELFTQTKLPCDVYERIKQEIFGNKED